MDGRNTQYKSTGYLRLLACPSRKFVQLALSDRTVASGDLKVPSACIQAIPAEPSQASLHPRLPGMSRRDGSARKLALRQQRCNSATIASHTNFAVQIIRSHLWENISTVKILRSYRLFEYYKVTQMHKAKCADRCIELWGKKKGWWMSHKTCQEGMHDKEFFGWYGWMRLPEERNFLKKFQGNNEVASGRGSLGSLLH